MNCFELFKYFSILISTIYLALAPNITEPPSNIDTVNDGRTVTIKCKHFGMPKPHIKWLRNNEELAGDHYSTLDNGDLQIR